MFYSSLPNDQRDNYEMMLSTIGGLSNLFSESDVPLIYYRSHENCFCYCFNAENLGREDCSVDAVIGSTGIGLKTFTGTCLQKVAEFGKLRPQYVGLSGADLVKKISSYRNDRLKNTANQHRLSKMVYHIVRRYDHLFKIYEADMEPIDISNISFIDGRGGVNSNYFSDGKHTYNFNSLKNTLYRDFSDAEFVTEFSVEILENPFEAIQDLKK